MNPIIFSNRGLVLRKLERYEDAIADYTKELSLSGEGRSKTRTLNNRAYCYAKIGDFKSAIRDYSSVIEKEDNANVHAYHNRGISYERIEEFNKAIEDFTEVIRLDPKNGNAFFNRGCCYDTVGELDLAITDYSVALELDMKNGEGGEESHAALPVN